MSAVRNAPVRRLLTLVPAPGSDRAGARAASHEAGPDAATGGPVVPGSPDGPVPADAALAAELADAAGRLLLDVRSDHADADPTELRTLGDRGSQELLAA